MRQACPEDDHERGFRSGVTFEKGRFPRAVFQRVAPAAAMCEVIAWRIGNGDHFEAPFEKLQRELAMLVDVELGVEAANGQKFFARDRHIVPAGRDPEGGAVGHRSQCLGFELVQPAGARTRINARLCPPFDRSEIMPHLVARHQHAFDLGAWAAQDVLRPIGPGQAGFGIEKYPCTAQMVRVPASDDPGQPSVQRDVA